ncbi:hypothetical protein D5S17_06845 [Pseudonocardiaceae bacterium YIM PH 21723]|nr:hypothetical protein D5S17_06845 [Pseudonocardiaceae bacterium YIM PH 21723]
MSGIANSITTRGLEYAYKRLNGEAIKEAVDQDGIHAYIDQCAKLAAGTGLVSGMGGLVTMVLGMGADVTNTVTQQFRVTLAVIYHRTGRHTVSSEEFFKIVGLSLGISAGAKGLQYGAKLLTKKIAASLAKKLSSRAAARIVPVLGAVTGAGINYAFIRSQGKALLAMDDKIFKDLEA